MELLACIERTYIAATFAKSPHHLQARPQLTPLSEFHQQDPCIGRGYGKYSESYGISTTSATYATPRNLMFYIFNFHNFKFSISHLIS